MNILHITPILPNSFLAGVYGKRALSDRFASGGAVYVYELARAQAKTGHSVTVVYPSIVPFDTTKDGVRFVGVQAFIRKPFSRLDPLGFIPIRVLLASDVVHIHQPRSYLAVSASFLAALLRKPIFVTDLGKTGKHTVPSALVAGYLDISRFAGSTHPKDKTTIIYAGIDVQKFQPVKQSHHRPYLFYAGAIREHKGQHHLVEIFTKIAKRYPTLDLVLAGGVIQPWYLEKIKTISRPFRSRIIIEGMVSEERLLSLYQQCEIFVSCSSHELFGLAIGEAMACGKPVIAVGVGSVPELVRHNIDGLIVPGSLWNSENKKVAFFVDTCVKAISRILDNKPLAKRLGENARKRIINHFTWDAVAGVCLSVYKKRMTY